MTEQQRKTFTCPYCKEDHAKEESRCPDTGREIPAHYKLIGEVLDGKYRLVRVLGAGGMGIVFEAWHVLVERKLAVKVLFPEIASKPEIVKRFHNEARTAAGIGHDHIIDITDMGMFGESPFIVMEYLHGQSLGDFMNERQLPVEDAVGILMQTLDALHAVHKKDVVHRDLKPDNIFLVNKAGMPSFVKILDFGISKLMTQEVQDFTLTKTGTVLGTPYYMSPEQAAGAKELDHRIDIYAAGVILYEMLTGKVPFERDNYNALMAAILTDEPPAPRKLNPSIPEEMEKIIRKALSKEPAGRYQDARQMMEALRPFAPSWALAPLSMPDLASTGVRVVGGAPSSRSAPTPIVEIAAEQGSSRMGISGMSEFAMQSPPVRARSKGLVVALAVVLVLAALSILAIVFRSALLGEPGRTGSQKKSAAAAGASQPGPPVIPDALKQPAADTAGAASAGGEKPVKVSFLGLPEGALVTIDDRRVEGNPAALPPSDQKRKIVIEAAGYKPWSAELAFNSDMTLSVDMPKVAQTAPDPEVDTGKKKKSGETTAKPLETVEKKPPEKKRPKADEKGFDAYKGKVELNTSEDYPE